MSELFASFEAMIANAHAVLLLAGLAASLLVLTRAADAAVDAAIELSRAAGVPTVVIGATVVSLGTTLPEVAVSVVAAAQGDSALAVGNATGSIVANIGLIGGVLLLLSKRRLEGSQARRPASLAFAAVTLLAATVLVTSTAGAARSGEVGASVPRLVGVLFAALLVPYLAVAARNGSEHAAGEPSAEARLAGRGIAIRVLRLLSATALVVISSRVLLPIVVELARRVGLPESLIAATLVAVGTSLPELSTAVAAARKNEGELALGNIAGANVMNVLLVVGVSAIVSPSGLSIDRYLLTQMVPAALGLSLALAVIATSRRLRVGRTAGMLLILAYVALLLTGVAAT